MTKAITDCSDAKLSGLVQAAGGKPFHARQLAHWVFKHRALSYDGCRNLPKALLSDLAGQLAVATTRISQRQVAGDKTLKLLLELQDGETVEAVLIPEAERTKVAMEVAEKILTRLKGEMVETEKSAGGETD